MIAKEIRRRLSSVADVLLWDNAFDAGTWLLGGILNRAQQSDFGIFVIREDDTARIKCTKYTTVRDTLISALEQHYKRAVVDTVYWWLILYGVITFDNIEEWTSGDWDYEDSV